MVENATYSPQEIYLRGTPNGQFKVSEKLFADFAGEKLYDPNGTIPLKVFRSKIRMEDLNDMTSYLTIEIFQMFLGFSNQSAFNLETTQQFLLYLKKRTSLFAYFMILVYLIMIVFIGVIVVSSSE